jgi:uncharacterized protein
VGAGSARPCAPGHVQERPFGEIPSRCLPFSLTTRSKRPIHYIYHRSLATLSVTGSYLAPYNRCEMIIDIDRQTLTEVNNAQFAAYAATYVQIYDTFVEQVRAGGLEIDAADYTPAVAQRRSRLQQKGAVFGNEGKSIYVNAISPACVACRKGTGSATFFISLQCHRDCYYCFNPNQQDYAYFSQHQRDAVGELARIHAAGQKISHLALTGGEPLLHPDEVVGFYRFAREKYPHAHQRLYTCGDYAKPPVLDALRDAGLDEIRFSIRMHDLAKGHRYVFERMAQARERIPQVMVEMPVLPGSLEIMQEVLLELDRLGIHSINLLEFCFPFVNAAAFQERGFKLTSRPYQVLYNYWYAGGLPIAGSELICLDLLEFALDRRLKLGVHYCSLENKHTGQMYQQNHGRAIPATHTFSERDYFLKSAKVFGADIAPVKRRFHQTGYRAYSENQEHDFLEFHVSKIPSLARLDVEIGLSTCVMEMRPDGEYLRELKLDLTYPRAFDPAQDV